MPLRASLPDSAPHPSIPVDLAALAMRIGAEAARHDAARSFPAEGFAALAEAGLLSGPLLSAERMEDLLYLLAVVGRGDLNVGRIFEGHVNALQLISLFGSKAQENHYQSEARRGRILGVWNTDAPGHPLKLEDGALAGAKNFASGVDGLSHAIVTVEEPGGRQMLIMPVADRPVDRSWWRPLGMKASGSHVVDFSGVEVAPEWFLGRPGDYVRQPWFSAGAIRFAAVQLGGAHAVLDAAREHLTRTGRADNPYQAHRLGDMALAVEGGYGWFARAAAAWRRGCLGEASEAEQGQAVATANAMRIAIEKLAMDVLTTAERAVGAAGLVQPHPLERLDRDLRTYLRQPNPDGALAAVGEALADGRFVIGRPPRDIRSD
ncbi:alkylation response protein AidB-like acyl-CoA dehydrogenase [Rhodopseudomonas julia]|uniref:Alkylation response protein AidB-like acyl-CoA dehydrogenase n=1 Tax=Rhodopseudomonas julia TaxID=200617 RepID=A0ABU0C488_9BRAD|nr:acyl-CoA dehydrogenase family protein [Rhodopseudomonas julia]MDQ0324774.1 alkylation response protein AidB-like acyl-CoA dehydrogenase [Rhodopseudomonas julia]